MNAVVKKIGAVRLSVTSLLLLACVAAYWQRTSATDAELNSVRGGCEYFSCIVSDTGCDSKNCLVQSNQDQVVNIAPNERGTGYTATIYAWNSTHQCAWWLQVSGGFCDYPTAVSGGVVIRCPSDRDLKKNLEPMDSPYSKIGLQAYRWTWNEKANARGLFGQSHGLLAQDVQKMLPFAVVRASDGTLMVNYSLVDSYLHMTCPRVL